MNRILLIWKCQAQYQQWYVINSEMKTTRYFEEQVLRKRPYIQRKWCIQALQEPIKRETQPDGRIRYWIFVPELGKHLRVVTLSDGETVHNAFPDRNFKEG